jgi:pimeloyl-ACP methyl ester carboxylesterase
MKRMFLFRLLVLTALALQATGCGTFVARRIMQAPNTYPTWFAPAAPVTLDYGAKFLTNFPKHYVAVGPPAARLCYRVVEPADYHLTVTTSNWLEHGKPQFQFSFDATVPGPANAWTTAPRGTVFLLHGYGLAQFSLAPWALRLAQDGWRCVLVDLRGHGRSDGKRVYFGIHETNDLSQLMNQLAEDGRLAPPAAVFGESYGAALALRWATVEPRVQTVVAIAPYASLSNAVLNICQDYASWLPNGWIQARLRRLPACVGVPAAELDTTTVLVRHPVTALFVAGGKDTIAPMAEVTALEHLAAPGSRLMIVPNATHEALTYYFDELADPVLAWLSRTGRPVPTEINK